MPPSGGSGGIGGFRYQQTLLSRPDPALQGGLDAGAESLGGGYESLATFGLGMAIVGLVTQTIGAYFEAKTQQYQLKSQALALDYEKSIANINARAAEMDAQAILESAQRQAGRLTLQYGQAKGAQRTSAAARGVQAGVGSAAEVQTSIELAKQIDAITIDANAARAAGAARMRGVGARAQGLLAGVSAANLRGAAGSISPFLAGTSTLLGGAGQVAGQWAQNRRLDYLYASRS